MIANSSDPCLRIRNESQQTHYSIYKVAVCIEILFAKFTSIDVTATEDINRNCIDIQFQVTDTLSRSGTVSDVYCVIISSYALLAPNFISQSDECIRISAPGVSDNITREVESRMSNSNLCFSKVDDLLLVAMII